VLADFVFRNIAPGTTVLELGCGTGLPGLVAMKCGCDVTLSDVTDDPDYWRKVGSVNGREVKFTPIKYLELEKLMPVDIILASDVLYDTKEFDQVLATIRYALDLKPGAKCWMAYQVRSVTRTIVPLLQYWELNVRKLESSTSTGHDVNIYEFFL